MKAHPGKIHIESVQSTGILTGEWMGNQFDEQHVLFVHYPDCQQLIIWLPQHHRFYEDYTITDQNTKEVIYHKPVRDVVNGSVQIILDSLPIPPGQYEIRIMHIEGIEHLVSFIKYHEEEVIPEPPKPPQPMHDAGPIVYRDGFGHILPDEDLELREKAMSKLKDQFLPKVTYESYGRGGYVIYTEDNRSVKFEMEYGGGKCVFYLFIPSEKHWEAHTGFPLSERNRILSYVAAQTQRDQGSSCRYEITEQYISYYRR